jgi:uncharacterized protein involved in exopolysaccharide biosynthesis
METVGLGSLSTSRSTPPDTDDRIDFRSLALALWRGKFSIAGATMAATTLGIVWALYTPRVFYSEAVISPKSPGADSRQGVLSQLGGLGLMASQLGVGNSNLDHMEVILKSKGLAERVISAYGLMPQLFPEQWDSAGHGWKKAKKTANPSLREGAQLMADSKLKVKADSKRQIIVIGIESGSPERAADWVWKYLAAFNEKIKLDVRAEADSNRNYLERQLAETTDPLLREKIQNLISAQIEKAMLVSSNSYDILEPPGVPMDPVRPRRIMMILFCLFSGLSASCLLVVLHSAVRAERK